MGEKSRLTAKFSKALQALTESEIPLVSDDWCWESETKSNTYSIQPATIDEALEVDQSLDATAMCISRMCTSDLNKRRTGCLGINRNDIGCWHMLLPAVCSPRYITFHQKSSSDSWRVSKSGVVVDGRFPGIPRIDLSDEALACGCCVCKRRNAMAATRTLVPDDRLIFVGLGKIVTDGDPASRISCFHSLDPEPPPYYSSSLPPTFYTTVEHINESIVPLV